MVQKIVSIPCVVEGDVCIITKDFSKEEKKKAKRLWAKLIGLFIATLAISTILSAKPRTKVAMQHDRSDKVKIEQNALQPIDSLTMLETIAPTLEELQNVPQEIHSAEFTVTAYCSCERCCGSWAQNRQGPVVGAAGVPLVAGYSVAVDNSIFPFGTVFTDPNGNEYVAADTGSGVNGYWLDIYMENHEAARAWGKQTITLSWD